MTTWLFTLDIADVFHDNSRPFEQKRDEIARRIRSSRFCNPTDYHLRSIVDQIAEADDPDEFDDAWAAFYDWADVARVWVKTVGRS